MYLFFIRRFNDVDHISPIVYKLAQQGKTDIRVLSQNPMLDLKNDFRLRYLRNEFNIDIDYVYCAHVHSIVTFLIATMQKFACRIRLFEKILMRFVFNNDAYKGIYNKEWARSFFKKVKPSVIVFDYIKKKQYITGALADAAQDLSIPRIAVPHGLNLNVNDLMIDSEVEKGQMSDLGTRIGFIDYIVAGFELYTQRLLKSGMPAEKIVVLGSARYCKEWRDIYRTIISDEERKQLPEADNKLKVVFMEYPYNYRIDKDRVVNCMTKIAQLPFVKMIIKPQTRANKLYAPELRALADIRPDLSSFVLCEWADVVIGTSSSILLEPLMMDKVFLYPKYFHENIMFYETYKACWIINSEEEMLQALRDIEEDKTLKKYNKEDVERLLTDIIDAGKKEYSVLDAYASFIHEKALTVKE